jgi:two-component system, LytTR family, sensor kinase
MKHSILGQRNQIFRVLSHVVFWLLSIVLFVVLIFYTRDFRLSAMDFATAVSILITIALLAISVYINLLWLLPWFFARRRFVLFAILEVGNIILFILLNYFISMAFEGSQPNYPTEMIAEFLLVMIFLVITTLIKFTRDSIALQDAQMKITDIEHQNIKSELQALKAQFNPHFLFNTLNSIYALSLDKSDKTPELILKLSELMRYVLYDTRDDRIPMKKQLGFLESFIYLERLRSDESRVIDMTVRGEHLETSIAPLLFEPFVENAFKHGARERQSQPYVRISFDLTGKEKVGFVIENNKDKDLPSGITTEQARGIGLANIRKRLELLYPLKHTLTIIEDSEIFRVELTIQTDEN